MGSCCSFSSEPKGRTLEPSRTTLKNSNNIGIERNTLAEAAEIRLKKSQGNGKLSKKLKMQNSITPGKVLEERKQQRELMWTVDS